MNFLRRICLTLLIPGVMFIAGCAETPSFQKVKNLDKTTNVVLITLDTTRADHLGCYGYESANTSNTDRTARSGVLCEKAFAPTPLTLPSHTSILTGLYPYSAKVHNNGTYVLSESAKTLAEIFGENDYKTAAFLSAFPLDSQYGLDQGFEVYSDDFSKGGRESSIFFQERSSYRTTDLATAWLRENKDNPFFMWIHYFDPHKPYEPPEDYKSRYSGNPYDGEIAYMDENMGRLFGILKELGLKSDTLVVITADHGESLGEHGEDSHGFFTYNSTLYVPLIFSYPGVLPGGKRISVNTSVLDIAPTVTSICNLESSVDFEGIDLLPGIFGKELNRNSPLFFESYLPYENFGWDKLEGVISGKWKFIETAENELYNLEKDWSEENNLADEYSTKEKKLRTKLTEMKKTASDKIKPQKSGHLSGKQARKLKSLGYIGAGSGMGDTGKKELKDPKKMIEGMKYIKAGEAHFSNENWDKTITAFEKVLKLDKDNCYALTMTGKAYASKGDEKKAEEFHKRALKEKKGYTQALINLGAVYVTAGRAEKAIKLCKRALEKNPTSSLAHANLSFAYQNLGNKEKAFKHLRAAIKYDPYRAEHYLQLGNLYRDDGQFEKAEEMLKEYQKLKPNDIEVEIALGAVYFKQKLYLKTIRHFNELLDKQPNKLIAYYYIGTSHKRLGNTSKAKEYLKTFVENWKGKEKFLKAARKEYEKL